MSDTSRNDQGAGPPQAGRLLIPGGLNAETIRASRIGAPVRRLSGATMGTGWSLGFAAPETVANAAVVAALEETFVLVIAQMSNWEPGSDLSRFNREPGWHDLKPEFLSVLTRALEIAEATGGAYDPALGAVVDRLGFGPTTAAHSDVSRNPGAAGVGARDSWIPASAGMSGDGVGWRQVELDAEKHHAFQPGGVALDLSSIAKGYAVDLCSARLRALGIPSFLMEIGGEFVGQGVKPDGHPWWVELQLSDLRPGPREPSHTDVALVNLALATSGDFVRRRTENGRPVSHLLDGRTQEQPGARLSGVAVLASTCMDADGWATALFALGPVEGLRMADQQNLAAVFSMRTPAGAATQLSPAAEAMLE